MEVDKLSICKFDGEIKKTVDREILEQERAQGRNERRMGKIDMW